MSVKHYDGGHKIVFVSLIFFNNYTVRKVGTTVFSTKDGSIAPVFILLPTCLFKHASYL